MLINKIPNIQLVHTDVNQAQVQAQALVEGHARQTTVTETDEKERIRPRQEGDKHPDGKSGQRKEASGAEPGEQKQGENGGEQLGAKRVDIVI